ncbi:hypothetical protein KY362_01065 [Candidatus Woesearchaeota archaeon]|nr:hypothetical protein [Candidatus Woesearchaeota archaeon]
MELTRLSSFYCILALALCLSAGAVSAQGTDTLQDATSDAQSAPVLSKHQTKMYINYGKVLVYSSMLFPEKQTLDFSIALPFDARSITDSIDNEQRNTELDANRLVYHFRENRLAQNSYITDQLLEGNTFIASMVAPFDTEVWRISLSLPEGAVLEKPMNYASVGGSSVYPRPKALETDGQAMTVVWEFRDVKKGDDVGLYVSYKEPFRHWGWVILGIIILILLAAGASYIAYSLSKNGSRAGREAREDDDERQSSHSHLKEDEEQIVNILKLKEGSCEQGTLRVATGFSKAKLSGLLKEMEQRKLVHKEKRGKKNLVFLK